MRLCFRRCLFVCLLATLRKNFWTNLHEISREGWQWASEQTITFWWRSGSPSGYRDCFPDSSLLGDTEVVNGVNLLLLPVIHSYWFGSWRDWYRDTGKTCLGGGMHCLSTSSSILPPYLMRLVLRGFQVVENFHDHARFILELDHGKT